PATADIPYWNNYAQDIIETMKHYRTRSFEAVNMEGLKDLPTPSDSPLESMMQELFELRKQEVKF
ncbi:MAG TPA: hypothetical protein PLO57_04775, partial [Candidatus Cloacimonadota bacterium]|nr:hypothetical protein [Candidatus Cloacimonadota bacterium]